MLNISNTSINKFIDRSKYPALRAAELRGSSYVLRRIILAFFLVLLVFLFVPWTQNIRSQGEVISLRQDQRPQTVHSVIAGQIQKWYVREGDRVKKGDTLVFISEVKDDYFDPLLLPRTQEQLKAKEQAIEAYSEKAEALEERINALLITAQLKIDQTRNKYRQAELMVVADSMDLEAYRTNYQIMKTQFERFQALYDKGLKSLTELENKRNSYRKAQAEMIAAENKLLKSRNELINAKIELVSIESQYKEYIAKSKADRFTTMSEMYDAAAALSKLQNQYANYSARTGYYYVTSPIDGYLTQAIQYGIGEIVKEGSPLISIMPAEHQLAVAMYVRPIDLPLLEKGAPVRIQFDGWPAIVFSGWPNTSYGTYGGKIYAIDNFISPNGMFRVLVQQDTTEYKWPDPLRVGSGANCLLLLKEVPIWYELWRKINGFPPDYYKPLTENASEKKQK